MKPKPLHRSVTFWSGILVMGFICWAWLDSTYRSSQMQFRTWFIVHGGSQISISREQEIDGLYTWRFPVQSDSQNLLGRASLVTQPSTFSFRKLIIPHWLLLLAVALPWSALLLWRARRWKRAVERIF